jgi:membrane-associated phospholipid phosphatase
MRQKFIVTILLFIIPQSFLFAQNRYNFSQFGNETADFIKQPLKWDGDDWLTLGAVGAGTILVMQIDQPVRDALTKNQSYRNSFPVKFGKLWGETYTTAAVAGAFALHGLLANAHSSNKVGFEIAQAALYAGGITTVLKAVIGRARPYTNKGPADYQPLTIFDDGYHSLPSGHSTLAFALSTVLSRNARSGALKILAYLPAVLTVFARESEDEHWTSDCILGGIIGYASATWAIDRHDQNDTRVTVSSIYPLTISINLN